MEFTEEELQAIQDDPITGVIELCKRVSKRIRSRATGPSIEDHQLVLEAYALLTSLAEAGLFPKGIGIPKVTVTGQVSSEVGTLTNAIERIGLEMTQYAATNRMETLTQQYAAALKARFSYEFTQGDLDRVQALLGELRQLIVKTKDLTEEHRRRLLKRLERLQSELHKRMSDLDHFWGLVGDAGVALGKLGTDAKPLVDRIREVVDIIWRTQARMEELPSSAPVPLLGHDSTGDTGTSSGGPDTLST